VTNYELLHGDVFTFATIKTHYNITPNIEQGLDEIFNSDRVNRWPTSITSCMTATGFSDLLAIPNIDDLVSWVKQCILDNVIHLGSPNATKVTFVQGWTNRSFKGSMNNCHLHSPVSTGCAIFYQNVPQPSPSDLVLVKNGKDETPLTSYEKKDCFRIKVKTGDLVIHHSSIPHGISKHKNANPRTCIVFNFKLN
jgi:hypothetical protein